MDDPLRGVIKRLKKFTRAFWVPGKIFTQLGFRYLGPFAGHHIEPLVSQLQKAKRLGGPTVVHVTTKKGKGYRQAERNPTLFHGIGPFDPLRGQPAGKDSSTSYTAVFGGTLIRIADQDPRVVAITAGMPTGTGLDAFSRKYPGHFYDVGIAEQHAVTFAAGMAAEGLRPVVAIYSTFLQRAYDQILHDVCLQNLPVVFMIDRAGLVGEDGPTHHGLFDLSYLRSLPNLIFMAPKDENELQHMLFTAIGLSRPVAIRYPRGAGTGATLDRRLRSLPVGKAEILQSGQDIAIFGIGSTVHPVLEAAAVLAADGLSCAAINSRFIKPIDNDIIGRMARQCRLIVTVEENVLQGGFGSAVLESLPQSRQLAKVHCIGIPDKFVEHGSRKVLRKKYGLNPGAIVQTVKQLSHRCSDPSHPLQRTSWFDG